jgi:hypothetical protein
VVHIKRLKKTYNQNIWKPTPNQKTNHRKSKSEEDMDNKQNGLEEEGSFIVTRHGIVT